MLIGFLKAAAGCIINSEGEKKEVRFTPGYLR